MNRVGVCVKLHDSHYQSYDEGNDHHQANQRERRVDRSHDHVLDVHEDEWDCQGRWDRPVEKVHPRAMSKCVRRISSL